MHDSRQFDLKICYYNLDFLICTRGVGPLGHILLYMTTKLILCRNKDVLNRINFRNY